ncbi:MAG: hypothetical protein ACRDYV_07075 [Acidimicrobiia bacterium]
MNTALVALTLACGHMRLLSATMAALHTAGHSPVWCVTCNTQQAPPTAPGTP